MKSKRLFGKSKRTKNVFSDIKKKNQSLKSLTRRRRIKIQTASFIPTTTASAGAEDLCKIIKDREMVITWTLISSMNNSDQV